MMIFLFNKSIENKMILKSIIIRNSTLLQPKYFLMCLHVINSIKKIFSLFYKKGVALIRGALAYNLKKILLLLSDLVCVPITILINVNIPLHYLKSNS